MSVHKDFVKTDENDFVAYAQKVCFVLSFEDVCDRLNRKITPDEWKQISESFEESLQEETGWQDLLDEAVSSYDLLKEKEDDDDDEEEDDDEDFENDEDFEDDKDDEDEDEDEFEDEE